MPQVHWLARLPGPLRAACCGGEGRYASGPDGPRQLFKALFCNNLLLNPSLQIQLQVLLEREAAGWLAGAGGALLFTSGHAHI